MKYIFGLNQIFSMLMTLGGVGIINYLIAEQLNTLDRNNHNSNTVKSISIIFTSIDSILYFMIQELLKNKLRGNWLIVITAVLTIILSVVLTLLLANVLHKYFYKIINKVRNKNGLVETTSTSTWKEIYETAGDKWVYAYCYTFDKTPIGWGYLQCMSKDTESNFSLNLAPAMNSDGQYQIGYDELVKNLGTDWYKDNYEIHQHINFKQSFIVITLIPIND